VLRKSWTTTARRTWFWMKICGLWSSRPILHGSFEIKVAYFGPAYMIDRYGNSKVQEYECRQSLNSRPSPLSDQIFRFVQFPRTIIFYAYLKNVVLCDVVYVRIQTDCCSFLLARDQHSTHKWTESNRAYRPIGYLYYRWLRNEKMTITIY